MNNIRPLGFIVTLQLHSYQAALIFFLCFCIICKYFFLLSADIQELENLIWKYTNEYGTPKLSDYSATLYEMHIFLYMIGVFYYIVRICYYIMHVLHYMMCQPHYIMHVLHYMVRQCHYIMHALHYMMR